MEIEQGKNAMEIIAKVENTLSLFPKEVSKHWDVRGLEILLDNARKRLTLKDSPSLPVINPD